jgi:hypothetical protein
MVYRWFQDKQRHWSWVVLLWNRAGTKFQPCAVHKEVYAIKACTVKNLD